MRIQSIVLLVLLIFSCRERSDPFGVESFNWEDDLNIVNGGVVRVEGLGKVRDLHFNDNRLFVGTEDNGVYIYDILSESTENSIALSNGQFLDLLYESREWGIGKSIRSLYYSDDSEILYAIDNFSYTYHGYLPYLLGDYEPDLCSPPDTLMQNRCSFLQSHATKFTVDDTSESPELYILYKRNANIESYLENSFSEVKLMQYIFPPEETLEFCDFIADCETDAISIEDSLSYNVNDIFYADNKLYIANPTENLNSFSVYDTQAEDLSFLDEYITDSPVRSIYSINNTILAGTENGCYITLLDDGGISDITESKLIIAEDFTIYDIFYDGERLILSCGSKGILVYDWNGLDSEPSESLRIMNSGNTTFGLEGFNYTAVARFYNGMYFVSTEDDGFQIYNIY